MGSPMRQPLEVCGAQISTCSARTRGALKVQRITAGRAARITKLGSQTSLWLGCMAFSFGACASDDSRASLHSENGHGVIPCRISEERSAGIRYRQYLFLRVPLPT